MATPTSTRRRPFRPGPTAGKAFLFGSLDPANYITVDKPPAALWLMELSSRLFGFSSFSMLLPQALEGVAAVALLYAAVRRWFGQSAALLSGLILAVTPVVALMFRFNNPEALLVLLLVLAAYGVTWARERGQTRWLMLAGTALGFAFLTKMLQGFLVLPAFGLVYAVARFDDGSTSHITAARVTPQTKSASSCQRVPDVVSIE